METDDTSTERIQQLETLLEEYKAANHDLEMEVESLRGSPSSSSSNFNSRRSWNQLAEEVERLTSENAALEQGMSPHSHQPLPIYLHTHH
jgi:outer membrane murein-binding lipoprotein Lpp